MRIRSSCLSLVHQDADLKSESVLVPSGRGEDGPDESNGLPAGVQLADVQLRGERAEREAELHAGP